MRGKGLLMVGIGILAIQTIVYGQLKSTKNNFIFSFCKLVSWSNEYKNGDFEIVVLGNTEVAKDLEAQAIGQKIGNQNFKIRRIESLNDLGKPSILFISKEQINKLNQAKVATENLTTMILTE